jgi:hypothetical protein
MDAEAQILYDRTVIAFEKFDAKTQAEMVVGVKAKLASHYRSVKAIGLGYAKCYVEAGEKFLEVYDK